MTTLTPQSFYKDELSRLLEIAVVTDTRVTVRYFQGANTVGSYETKTFERAEAERLIAERVWRPQRNFSS